MRESCCRSCPGLIAAPLALGTAGAGRYTARRTIRRRGVHESDSFISEVSEEVRRDRLFAALRRYGWLIGGAVLLIVGGAAVNEWRKARQAPRAEAAGRRVARRLCRDRRRDPCRPCSAISPRRRPRAAVVARLAEAGSLRRGGRDRRRGGAPRRGGRGRRRRPALPLAGGAAAGDAARRRHGRLRAAGDAGAARRPRRAVPAAGAGAAGADASRRRRQGRHGDRRPAGGARRAAAPPRRCAAGRGS